MFKENAETRPHVSSPMHMSSRLNHKAHRLLDLLGLQSYEPTLDHACRTSESHGEVDNGLSHIKINDRLILVHVRRYERSDGLTQGSG